MSVFGVLRGFTFLARDVFEAALDLIPAPGLSGYDLDGAEQLAEKEAAEECSEPMDCGLGGDFSPAADGLNPLNMTVYTPLQAALDDSTFRSGGQTKQYGPRPRLSTPSWFKSTPESEALLAQERVLVAIQETGAAVEALLAIAEDIRNLLQHNAPVASASPPTPADATGSDPTLANDPQSVHQRHMRRLLGEDKGRP